MDIAEIAVAATTVLAPYAPYLVEFGQKGGEKLAEVIAEKGGEAAWEQAQAIWKSIRGRVSEDPKLNGAVTLVSAEPEDETYLKVLAEAMALQMRDDPDLAKALFTILDGQESVQRVIASSGSWARNIVQETTGGGSQIVEARDGSIVDNVHQTSK